MGRVIQNLEGRQYENKLTGEIVDALRTEEGPDGMPVMVFLREGSDEEETWSLMGPINEEHGTTPSHAFRDSWWLV